MLCPTQVRDTDYSYVHTHTQQHDTHGMLTTRLHMYTHTRMRLKLNFRFKGSLPAAFLPEPAPRAMAPLAPATPNLGRAVRAARRCEGRVEVTLGLTGRWLTGTCVCACVDVCSLCGEGGWAPVRVCVCVRGVCVVHLSLRVCRTILPTSSRSPDSENTLQHACSLNLSPNTHAHPAHSHSTRPHLLRHVDLRQRLQGAVRLLPHTRRLHRGSCRGTKCTWGSTCGCKAERPTSRGCSSAAAKQPPSSSCCWRCAKCAAAKQGAASGWSRRGAKEPTARGCAKGRGTGRAKHRACSTRRKAQGQQGQEGAGK